MKHTIYHIPGQKVGCTANFSSRAAQYPEGTKFEILEELQGATDKEAGDIEWAWADKLGYCRDDHYTKWNSERAIARDAKLGYEGVLARYRKGRETMGEEGMKKAALKAMKTMGPEGLSARALKGKATMGPARVSEAAKKTAAALGKEGCSARTLKGWENREQSINQANGGVAMGAILRTCDVCGHQGRGANIFRYHFKNCKAGNP